MDFYISFVLSNSIMEITYILVWFTLIIFTVITVTVAGINFGKLSILIPILIAGLKSWLVLWFFMNLKYEKKIFKNMFFFALITLIIIIGFTFLDVSYR